MAECYYSYSFDLENGLIMDEVLDKNSFNPMKAVGLSTPLNFDDFVDVWMSMCFPIFENEEDSQKLTCSYLKSAYERGEKEIFVDLEHNPLQNTYAAKYTRVRILLFNDTKRDCARATVMWEELSRA